MSFDEPRGLSFNVGDGLKLAEQAFAPIARPFGADFRS
jgi:hypothetical protein